MRFYVLDIFRFSAALAVVFYHYTARGDTDVFSLLSNITKFGYLGVPLFFIISGFVISASAYNRLPSEFAVSRFVRLFPALWVGVSFTFLTVYLLGMSDVSIMQYFTNLTMFNSYFGYSNIDGVYWTLIIEIKFYICVFILLTLGIFEKYKVWLSVWMLCTLTYLFCGQPFFMSWIINPHYSSLFIAGVAFYLIRKQGFDHYNIIILFFSLIVSAFYGYEQAAGFVNNASVADRVLAVFITSSFYLLFLFLVLGKLNIRKSIAIETLGGMTYSLYLIHCRAGHAIIDKYKFVYDYRMIALLVGAFMLITSYLIYTLIEKRFSTPLKTFLLSQLPKRMNVLEGS